MRWWQMTLMIVLVMAGLLLKGVPMSEWAKWRTWFHPRKYEPHDDEPHSE
jgi:hypothetical protein